MRRLRTVAAAVIGLVGLLAAFSPTLPQGAGEPTLLLVAGDGHRRSEVRFTVAGTSVRGLYPGAVKQIRLRIVNPYGFALRIQSLSGKVTATSRRTCAATGANLQIRPYTGRLPLTVPARARTEFDGALPVTMPSTATAGCASTRFTIVLLGTGTKASR
jgi:hypothetical protein